jgi:hypothetical protein
LPPERLVTLANWQDPMFNRWAFQHVRELVGPLESLRDAMACLGCRGRCSCALRR